MKTILLSILAFVFVGLSNNEIIIRHDISEQEYIEFAKELPVTSAIVHYNSTDLAGTLISSRWVLSAAHVAETIKADHKLIIDGDSVGIENIILHPGWDANGRPDLALIQLNKEITTVEPIKLFRKEDEVGKQVVVAGIGNSGTGKTGVEGNPGTMRAATNLVDGSTQDKNYLYWLFDSPESDNVTRLEGIAGPGDSAGPAFIQVGDAYYLAGVGSAQSTQATGGIEGLYGVTEYYVRVSTFIDWVEKTISE